MTIRKGDDWGSATAVPPNLLVVGSDAELSRHISHQRRADVPIDPVGVSAGDLARTMGGGTHGRFDGTVVKASIDIVRVEANGEVTWAAAHVIARRRWWRGEVLCVMNAQFLGPLDLAPRGHPNDGRAESLHVQTSMPWRARRQALRRARTGTHLPHPQIQAGTVGVNSSAFRFRRPLNLWVDGVMWQRATAATFTIEPDAIDVFA